MVCPNYGNHCNDIIILIIIRTYRLLALHMLVILVKTHVTIENKNRQTNSSMLKYQQWKLISLRKKSVLLSDFLNVDPQKASLFTNKGQFAYHLCSFNKVLPFLWLTLYQ